MSKEEVEEYVNKYNPWEGTIASIGVSAMHVAHSCNRSGVVNLWKTELDANYDPNVTITYASTVTLNQEKKLASRRKRKANDTEEDAGDTSEVNFAVHDQIPIHVSVAVPYLQTLWRILKMDHDIIDKWYAALFYGQRKKTILYIGKVTNLVQNCCIEINWLKPAVGNTTQLESIPIHLPQDQGSVALCDVIAGPLVVSHIKGNKWNVPEHIAVKNYVRFIEKVEREQIMENIDSEDRI